MNTIQGIYWMMSSISYSKSDNSNVNTTASNVANQSSNSANLNGSLSYLNANNSLSNTNANISSQLLLFTISSLFSCRPTKISRYKHHCNP